MTGTSAPVAINNRTDRSSSDNASGMEDMSFISSSMITQSYDNNVHDSQSTVVTASAEVHDSNFLNLGFSNDKPEETEMTDSVSTTIQTTPFVQHMDLDRDVVLLPGEIKVRINQEITCEVEGGSMMCTNFRVIYLSEEDPQTVTVLTLHEIEVADLCDVSGLKVTTKGGRLLKFVFKKANDSFLWHQTIVRLANKLYEGHMKLADEFCDYILRNPIPPSKPNLRPIEGYDEPEPDFDIGKNDIFAFRFSRAVDAMDPPVDWLRPRSQEINRVVHHDFERLSMQDDFRISRVNEDFQLCETYPDLVIVPKEITDEDIKKGAVYRGLCRFPAVVWRCMKTKAVLLRSAQPQVGFLGWRNQTDELYIEKAVKAARMGMESEEKKQFIIMDARSYTSAFANRARSGGFENTEYYQQCKIEFLSLPNIHSVRSSFLSVRNVLQSLPNNDQALTALSQTSWLQNMSLLIGSAWSTADYLIKGHSVLVHCSDGWDRTTQLVCLAKIMIDKHYRTIEGFEQLIRREWQEFGHKFHDRSHVWNVHGNWDAGERCPVFYQFVEAVRHLQRENPTAFEFTHAYLLKLAQHVYSGLFGTFIFNSMKQRQAVIAKRQDATLVEIWRYLGKQNEEFVNQSFDNDYVGTLKTIRFGVIHLRIWHELFIEGEANINKMYDNINAAQVASKRTASGTSTPSSNNGLPLVKSKSSESVNSLVTDGSPHPNAIAADPNAAAEPLQNALLNLSMSSSCHQPSNAIARDFGISQLDNDGLLMYPDDEQEQLRKKNHALLKEIKRQENIITDLKNRQQTGKDVEGTSKDEQSTSQADNDNDSVVDKPASDMSLVEPEHELPNLSPSRPNTSWELPVKNCFLCEREFSMLSVYAEDRKHHCRNCGRVVCDSCSKNRFHVIEEGQGVQKRACDACYEAMQNNAEVEEEHGNQNETLSRASSMSEISYQHVSSSAQPPSLSPSSISLNTLPSQSSKPIPTSCKSSSTSISSPRPSPSEFSRHGSSQAVKG